LLLGACFLLLPLPDRLSPTLLLGLLLAHLLSLALRLQLLLARFLGVALCFEQLLAARLGRLLLGLDLFLALLGLPLLHALPEVCHALIEHGLGLLVGLHLLVARQLGNRLPQARDVRAIFLHARLVFLK
jgi:hypothetical protein